MKDEAAFRRAHHHDVVIHAGPVLEQHEYRATVAVDFVGEPRFRAGHGHACPSPALEFLQQIRGANAARLLVDEMRERLGVHAALAPEAEHHRGGGAAAERFGL